MTIRQWLGCAMATFALVCVWVVGAERAHSQSFTGDPIPAAIQKSGIAIALEPLVTIPKSAVKITDTHADINFVYPAFDGSKDLYVADVRGVIWRIANGQVVQPAFLDVRVVRQGAFYVDHVRETGFRSFAFHPDCGRPGRPGYCKLYTSHTETVASAPATTKLFKAGFTQEPLYHNVVDEWTVDLSGVPKVVLSSRRELLRVEQRARHHNLDQLMFDPNAVPGDPNYGLMWMSIGDGMSNPPNQDPDNQARNPMRILGKIARINPLKSGALPYTVPASNPHVNTPGFLPEIWARGFRHPQNIAFDTGGTGQLFMIDIGESKIEEVNIGVAGGDYGWPERQGTFVNNRKDPTVLSPLPSNDATLGFTYPVAQYDHGEGFAIAGGYVYRGKEIPELFGHYIFGDIVKGRVFHVPVSQLKLGSQAVIKELTLKFAGVEKTLPEAIDRARADLRIGIDTDNELYISSKQSGQIWRVRKDNSVDALDHLVSPDGAIDNRKPQFVWRALANTKTYRLQVSGGVSPITKSLTAANMACANINLPCSYTGITLVPGRYSWAVTAIDNAGGETPLGRHTFEINGAISAADFKPTGPITDPRPQFEWPFIAGAIEYQMQVTKSTGDVSFGVTGTPTRFNCASAGQLCTYREPTLIQGAYDWVVRYRTVANGPWIDLAELNFTLSLSTPPNGSNPPIVRAGPDLVGRVDVRLPISGSVQDDGPVTSRWSVTQASNGFLWAVKLLSPEALSQNIKVTRPGTYVLRLTANDGTSTVFDEITLTIVGVDEPLPESPTPEPPTLPPVGNDGVPVVNAGPDIIAAVDSRFLLNGAVADSGPVSSVWTVLSASGDRTWAVKLLRPDATSQFIKVTRSGVYVLRLTATDGVNTVFDDTTLTILAEGQPVPSVTVDAGADIQAQVDVKFPLAATVSDGATITWSVVEAANNQTWAVKLNEPTSLTQSIKVTRPGRYVLEIAASKDGATATDRVTIDVAG